MNSKTDWKKTFFSVDFYWAWDELHNRAGKASAGGTSSGVSAYFHCPLTSLLGWLRHGLPCH